MREWRAVTLGEVLSVVHGFAFRGEFFTDSGSAVLVTPKNFRRQGGLDLSPDRCKFYEGPIDDKYVLKGGDVVMALTDLKNDAPILGATGVVPFAGRYLHNQRIGKVVVDQSDRLAKAFVPWLLNSPEVRARVRSSATGATVRHSAPARIAEIAVPIPDLQTQERIAATLSAFDELIEINEQRIELLEDLARSLYREWFVRFRFPGHQDIERVDSELGAIPEGWEVHPAGDILGPVGGGTPSKKLAEYWERGEIPWFTPSDLTRSPRRYVSDSETRITPLGLAQSGARLFPAGSVLMTSRATLGVLAIATRESACNQGFIVIPPVEGVHSAFLYEWLASQQSQLATIATGATFKEITKTAFKRFPFLLPAGQVLARFAEVAEHLGQQIRACERHNRALAATRDLLLPRLVTGRLDISDIELGDLLPDGAA